MKSRPLIATAISYAAGILLERAVPADPRCFLSVGPFLLLAWRWPKTAGVIELLIILAGWTSLSMALASILPADIRMIIGSKPDPWC